MPTETALPCCSFLKKVCTRSFLPDHGTKHQLLSSLHRYVIERRSTFVDDASGNIVITAKSTIGQGSSIERKFAELARKTHPNSMQKSSPAGHRSQLTEGSVKTVVSVLLPTAVEFPPPTSTPDCFPRVPSNRECDFAERGCVECCSGTMLI
jgi:hypothetical protein